MKKVALGAQHHVFTQPVSALPTNELTAYHERVLESDKLQIAF